MVFVVVSILLCHMFRLCAGLVYRTGKSFDKAIQAYERAADAHYKNNAYPYSAATND